MLGPQGLLALLAVGMASIRLAAAQRGRQTLTIDGVTTASLRGSIGTANDGQLIFGPFDAGFSANQICSGHDAIVGGTDTFLAAALARYECNNDGVSLFDACGGHARPYHYHEGMTCLYQPDAVSGHSTSVGALTAGQKMYGKWEADGVLPELDACNGHFGVTPDSNGEPVYHYHVTDEAPFTAGCVGPAVDAAGNEQLVTVEQCRAVYSTCDGATSDFVIGDGITMTYDLDCPCFDKNERNYGEIAALTYSSGSGAPAQKHDAASTEAPAAAAATTAAKAAKANNSKPASTKKAPKKTTTEAPAAAAASCADKKPKFCAKKLTSEFMATKMCKRKNVQKKCQASCGLC